jgi:hypothetical protein
MAGAGAGGQEPGARRSEVRGQEVEVVEVEERRLLKFCFRPQWTRAAAHALARSQLRVARECQSAHRVSEGGGGFEERVRPPPPPALSTSACAPPAVSQTPCARVVSRCRRV